MTSTRPEWRVPPEPHPILIEEAKPMPDGRVQLKLEIPRKLKRDLALFASNEGSTLLAVAQRALERAVAEDDASNQDNT